MKNPAHGENSFIQQLIAGVRLHSPLQFAFLLAFALLMLAFGAGLFYAVTERGMIPDIMLNHLSEADGMAQQGDFRGATQAYRRAAMVAPDDLVALLRLHSVASVNQDNENIWWALRRALQVDPRNAAVQMLAGDAYLDAMQYELAQQHFTVVLRLLPDTVDASYKLGYLNFQLDDMAAARRWFEYTLALDPGHTGARQYMISMGSNNPQ